MSNSEILKDNETPHDYRIKFDKKEIELFKKLKVNKILEVFSGNGQNVNELNKLGFEVIGIKNQLFNQRIDFNDNLFDCVYSYQYINHNYKSEIEILFKEIFRVLKKGGIFSIKISDMSQFNLKHIKDDIYEENDSEFPKIKFKKLENQTFIKLEGDEKGIIHYAFFKDELIESITKIGFELINIRTIKWNLVANFKK